MSKDSDFIPPKGFQGGAYFKGMAYQPPSPSKLIKKPKPKKSVEVLRGTKRSGPGNKKVEVLRGTKRGR